MKRNLFITGIACTILFLTGCKDDDSPNLRIEAESNIQVECKKDTINIPIFCNMPSKATITYDSPDKSGWIFLLPSVLNGDGIFTLWIDEYSNVLEDRTATFLVTAGDETKRNSYFSVQTNPASFICAVSVYFVQKFFLFFNPEI